MHVGRRLCDGAADCASRIYRQFVINHNVQGGAIEKLLHKLIEPSATASTALC